MRVLSIVQSCEAYLFREPTRQQAQRQSDDPAIFELETNSNIPTICQENVDL